MDINEMFLERYHLHECKYRMNKQISFPISSLKNSKKWTFCMFHSTVKTGTQRIK